MSNCPAVRSTTEWMPLVPTEEQGEETPEGKRMEGREAARISYALGKHQAPIPELGPCWHIMSKEPLALAPLHSKGYGGGLLLKSCCF